MYACMHGWMDVCMCEPVAPHTKILEGSTHLEQQKRKPAKRSPQPTRPTAGGAVTQRLRKPLIKEYTFNLIRVPMII